MLTAHFNGNEIETAGTVALDDVYPGVCCEGHGWRVLLVMGDPDDPDVWGHCDNPDCPGDCCPDDPACPYRGIRVFSLEDLAERLAELEAQP